MNTETVAETATEVKSEAAAKPAKKAAAKKKAAPKAKVKAKAKAKAPKAAKNHGIDVPALKKALKKAGVEFDKKANVTDLVALAEKSKVEVPSKASGNIIDEKYRKRYGANQNNGDKFAEAMDKACKVEVAAKGKGKPKRVLDEKALRSVAKQNNVDTARWSTMNLGQQRMNLGNVLRGMNRRGEKITIGTKVFAGVKEGKGGAL